MEFDLPPHIHTANGEKRRVGFELEFGGLSIPETAQILIDLFDGTAFGVDQYTAKIKTRLGDFQIEADSSFLKERKYKRYLDLIGIDATNSVVGQGMDGVFGNLAGTLIPFEIVTPPLDIDALTPIEQIRASLFEHSARGTKSAIFTAFGMQFNPQVVSTDAESLLRHLRAFFLLFDWLYEESDIPVARKLAPYIQDFPEDYVRLVLDPPYAPNQESFMRDYLRFNPTRNRPLDLLPLFAHINRRLVFEYPVEKELVKARPTFHYRLPNSMVDDPNWMIATDWNKWVQVERLAEDGPRLKDMTKDFFSYRQDHFLFVHSKWADRTRTWLHER